MYRWEESNLKKNPPKPNQWESMILEIMKGIHKLTKECFIRNQGYQGLRILIL